MFQNSKCATEKLKVYDVAMNVLTDDEIIHDPNIYKNFKNCRLKSTDIDILLIYTGRLEATRCQGVSILQKCASRDAVIIHHVAIRRCKKWNVKSRHNSAEFVDGIGLGML